MSGSFFKFFFNRAPEILGSDRSELIFGSIFGDNIKANGGNDLVIAGFGKDTVDGGDGEDLVFGGFGRDNISGGNDDDHLFGGRGNDVVIGNKGDDRMFGGRGRDLLVWNNGDGSDLIDGGRGYDRQQVNFDTDRVNIDLQNDDVAEFSVTNEGIQFARVELNGQSVNGLFQLDIRNTEVQETNFGAGNDEAQIVDDVLDRITLKLDGGEGVDNLDFSRAASGVAVDLAAGTIDASVAVNFENVTGTEFDDVIKGDDQNNVISGLGGADSIFGGDGDDELVANKGNDFVFGGYGDDLIVWNNGDGSDLFVGGEGNDKVQVNFDTDLVNSDLQNKDVAEFSVTPDGVQFARVELNDQAVNGLFQLDIRETETLETNFGDNDDEARIVDDVLDQIVLDLDGGEGVDTLDLSRADRGIEVDLEAGTLATSAATNFENVTGTDFDDVIGGDAQDNIIRGGSGNDELFGGEGADSFVFFEEDVGVDVILDFEFGEDSLVFVTEQDLTANDLLGQLTQDGDDVELAVNGKVITFADVNATDFGVEEFLIA